MNTEILRIVVEGVNKGFTKVSEQVNNSMKSLKLNFQAFNNVMGMTNQQIKRVGVMMGHTEKMGAKFGMTIRRVGMQLQKATHFMRKYRMEILGVLFFSMYLQNVFKGWLQPAMDAFGMFELFSTMLLVLFIPVMEQIMPYFLQIMEYMMNLEPETKKLIGVFTVMGLVLSTLILWVAKFAIGIGVIGDMIGIGGITGVFNAFFTIVSRGFALVLGLGATTLAVLAVIIIGAVLAWKENFGGFRDWIKVLWEGIKNMFIGVWKIIEGLFKAIFSLIKGDTEGFWNAMKQIWDGVVQFLWGFVQTVIGFFVALGLAVLRALVGIFNVFYGTWKAINKFVATIGRKIWSAIKKTWDTVWTTLKKIVSNIYNHIKNNFNAIVTFIKTIFSVDIKAGIKTIWDFISKGFGDLVDSAFDWAKDLAQGFIDGLKAMGSSIKNAFSIFGGDDDDDSNSNSGSSSDDSRTKGDRVKLNPETGVWEDVNDFILQPGGRLIKTDPNDTIMGRKKGGIGGITINQTNNISGTLMRDIDNAISEANKRLVDDIKRMSGA